MHVTTISFSLIAHHPLHIYNILVLYGDYYNILYILQYTQGLLQLIDFQSGITMLEFLLLLVLSLIY